MSEEPEKPWRYQIYDKLNLSVKTVDFIIYLLITVAFAAIMIGILVGP